MLQTDGDSKIINDQEAELQKMFYNFSGLSISCKALKGFCHREFLMLFALKSYEKNSFTVYI